MTDRVADDGDPEDLFIKGLAELDPTPDEDAWDAFVTLAIDRIDGSESTALSNAQLAELEAAIGATLPFEVGLLLIMGVPDDDAWWGWSDPAVDVERWHTTVQGQVLAAVETDNLWPSAWGPRPGAQSTREDVVQEQLAAAAPLLPLYEFDAIPLGLARDEPDTSANPVLRLLGGRTTPVAVDLAAWLHLRFDVPLPMWPETPPRWFPLWSELT